MEMQVSSSIEILAPLMDVWKVIADIESAGTTISGIKSVEILEEASGPSIVGLKWRETREWLGRDAVEVMWITEAREASYYETRAESHGSIYTSRMELAETSSGTQLTMGFNSQPLTFGAKVLWALTGWMAKRSLCKVIDQDLQDIKGAVEKAV